MRSPAEKNKRTLRPLPVEDERQMRLEKTLRLRCLRAFASSLSFDPDAQFHDEIDCSALFADWNRGGQPHCQSHPQVLRPRASFGRAKDPVTV
ncbi:MAG: hypothetical protein E5X74_29260 [Mesorhizobium sp.]|nr:MAG: hypothetical protein EOR74_30910 [Mesorhizobium sp.]RWM37156.1 MAG: hypothetical protein EOR75_20705 [Mesorhizobium sp.]TIO72807.1 MAG: hypothetical protein E5X75_31065 [Mesorhizobium sp.]TIO81346.1 MAG: hypothetical protein E5X74_29260 [Mesorhizobium sp.]TJV51251.1 MAG: hypothetical protein E5Y01_15020 [Mesorhizobium sp.]